MNRRDVVSYSAVALIGLTLLPGNALSQQKPLKEQIVGSWTYASSETVRTDGSRVKPGVTMSQASQFSELTVAMFLWLDEPASQNSYPIVAQREARMKTRL
jgi:hypothetical protein